MSGNPNTRATLEPFTECTVQPFTTTLTTDTMLNTIALPETLEIQVTEQDVTDSIDCRTLVNLDYSHELEELESQFMQTERNEWSVNDLCIFDLG